MNSTVRLRPYSVSELNRHIADVLEQDLFLQRVLVSGEISGLKIYSGSGHAYFTLKDESSAINCVMFSNWLRRLPFTPKEGMQVYLSGSVSVYQKQGRYQIYAEKMQPAGIGEYYLNLEYLKQKLQEEGLFDTERKKSLPPRPSCIGIVTSVHGAALQDMIRILRLRQPGIKIIVAHSLVQGTQAAAELKAGIEKLNRHGQAEVIIIGRGGGSAEDLRAFNEEAVVRAVFASQIPVISAVGHEVDYSLTDLAADVRAATPTQAAQLAVPDDEELLYRIRVLKQTLSGSMKRRLQELTLETDELMEYLQNHIESWLIEKRKQKLMDMIQRMEQAAGKVLQEKKNEAERQLMRLNTLNPLQTLKRGYACIRKDHRYIDTVADVQENDQLWVKMQDGEMKVQVLERKFHEENEI